MEVIVKNLTSQCTHLVFVAMDGVGSLLWRSLSRQTNVPVYTSHHCGNGVGSLLWRSLSRQPDVPVYTSHHCCNGGGRKVIMEVVVKAT